MKTYLDIIKEECDCEEDIIGCAVKYEKHMGENFCGIGKLDRFGNIKTECDC